MLIMKRAVRDDRKQQQPPATLLSQLCTDLNIQQPQAFAVRHVDSPCEIVGSQDKTVQPGRTVHAEAPCQRLRRPYWCRQAVEAGIEML